MHGCYRVVISGRCHNYAAEMTTLFNSADYYDQNVITTHKILSLIICGHSHLTALEAAQCK